MREGTVQIVNKLGIHARAATKLVSLTKTFPCTIQLGIERNALVNAKSMMSVLTLAAAQGTELILVTEGEGEEGAYVAVKELIDDRFGETE